MAPKGGPEYRQLWRLIDGAVADAFSCHPDYLTTKGVQSARTSITKRVTGVVHGYAARAAKGSEADASGGGSGFSPAAEMTNGEHELFVDVGLGQEPDVIAMLDTSRQAGDALTSPAVHSPSNVAA